MRVLHFLRGRCSLQSSHGVDKTVYFLSRAQAKESADVGVFCLSPKEVVEIPHVEVANFKPSWNAFSVPPDLIEACKCWQPDFIHLHCPYQISNVPIAKLARKLKIPYAITAHGNLSPRLLNRNPLLKKPYKRIFDLPLFNRSAFVHAISDMDDIRAYGVTRPLVVAPNGFDLQDLPEPLNSEKSGFPQFSGKDLVLYLGRLDIEQKGLDLLLKAFSGLQNTNPNAHLALAGPDWKGSLERLESLAGSLGLKHSVTFCGAVPGPQKYHLMKAARLFVHPSRWEAGIPFSVLEALATGTPVLLSAEADPNRRVEKRGAGLHAKLESDSWAEAIRNVLSLPSTETDKIGNYARDLIKSEFGWQASAKTLLSAYRNHLTKPL